MHTFMAYKIIRNVKSRIYSLPMNLNFTSVVFVKTTQRIIIVWSLNVGINFAYVKGNY